MKLAIGIAITVALTASPLLADDLADKRAAYIAAGKVQRDKEASMWQKQVDDNRAKMLEHRKNRSQYNANVAASYAKQMARAATELKALGAVVFRPPRIDVDAMKTGQIGLPVIISSPANAIGHEVAGRVAQVIDRQNVLIRCANYPEQLLWVHTDTTDMVDDQIFTFRRPYEVLGTKTYATAGGGTQTVFELAEFDPGPTP